MLRFAANVGEVTPPHSLEMERPAMTEIRHGMAWHGRCNAPVSPSGFSLQRLPHAVAGGRSAPSIFQLSIVHDTTHVFRNNNAIGSVFSYELIYEVILRILQAMICAGTGTTVLYKERETTSPYLKVSSRYLMQLLKPGKYQGWLGLIYVQ